MKKILLLTLSLFFATISSSSASFNPYDPNGSGTTTMADVLICYKQYLGLPTGYPPADVDGGGVTMRDVLKIYKRYLGLPSGGGGGNGGTTLRVLPGQFLSAWIDTNTGENYVAPQTLMAAGGSPFAGYTWSTSGFPMGTTVAPLTGVFSSNGGTIIAGHYPFTVEVSDGTSTATGIVTLNVTTVSSAPLDGNPYPQPGCPEILLSQMFVDSFVLDDAHANKPYGASLFAVGGTPPYSWREDPSYSATSDLRAAGLTIDHSSGIVRGTLFNSSSGKTLKFRVIVQAAAPDTDGEIQDANSRTGVKWTVYTITVK